MRRGRDRERQTCEERDKDEKRERDRHVKRDKDEKKERKRTRQRCTFVTVIVNVSPADDEQDARVPKTGEEGKKRAQAG